MNNKQYKDDYSKCLFLCKRYGFKIIPVTWHFIIGDIEYEYNKTGIITDTNGQKLKEFLDRYFNDDFEEFKESYSNKATEYIFQDTESN